MDKKLHKKIAERKEKGTLRSLSLSSGMTDFGSNDYLGFANLENTEFPSGNAGASGSRLITGNKKAMEDSELSLAAFFDAETALCYNSGYDANIGLFGSIPQRGDVILYDESIHASARDGIRLSLAKAYSFKHNSSEDLARLLENNKASTCYIALEALYSMEGDFSPLLEVCELADKYNAYVVLDEAHSAGIYGNEGKGYSHALGLHEKLLIRLITFGKAYGSHGAVVLCSNDMRTYLINFSRSLIYTTALPASCYTQMATIVQHLELNERRTRLQNNIAYFREKSSLLKLSSATNSPIQNLSFESILNLKEVEQKLKLHNIFVKAIYAPTVAEGSECLRICIHAENTVEELDKLLLFLNGALA